MKTIKTWYCPCGPRQKNFGDKLTKILLEHLTPYILEMAPKSQRETCQLLGIGSILHVFHPYSTGIVWTTGFMQKYHKRKLDNANVIAVRGQLTLDRIEMSNKKSVILGDGGLIVDCLLQNRKPNKLYKLGLIPHYIDQNVPVISELAKQKGVKFIDICDDHMTVLKQASLCEFILSSSLHGLILADSLGIPNQWIELSDKVNGKGFKYQDYYSVFGMHHIKPYNISPDINQILFDFEKFNYMRKGIDSIKENLYQTLKLI